MKRHMNKSVRSWLILITIVVVAVLAAFWATSGVWFAPFPFERRLPPTRNIPGDIEFYYTAQTVISSINVTLSVFLLLIYIDIYEKTRSEFTIGLIIFSCVFLLNALASNPFVIWAFGFRPFGLGPFVLLPDVFAFGALAVLLYFSVKY
jgi:hypothetical protein